MFWIILTVVLMCGVMATAAEPAARPSITVALVGCAHIHTPGFVNDIKKRSDVKVKSVWDHDVARARNSADKLGAAVVEDVNAIWSDPEIKAVVICSETNRHEELVTAAAKAGKHMYAEKPLGTGARDAATMLAAIESSGVVFQTGYGQRSLPIHLFLKEQIAAGAFGKITRARMSMCHSGALGGWFDTEWRWMADPKQAGVGGYGDLGTHALDLLMWFFGDVDRCTAQLDNGTARYRDCDELGEGLIRFKSGVIATLAAGWDDVANPVTIEIAGTEGHAVVVNGELFFKSNKVKGADGKAAWKDLPKGLPSPLNLFLDAVGGAKDVPLTSAREAAARSAVMESLYQGAQQQKWVNPIGQ